MHKFIFVRVVYKGQKAKGQRADGGRYVTNYELRITNDGRKANGVAKTRGYPNKRISVELLVLNIYHSAIVSSDNNRLATSRRGTVINLLLLLQLGGLITCVRGTHT